jgi:hypothetical protein
VAAAAATAAISSVSEEEAAVLAAGAVAHPDRMNGKTTAIAAQRAHLR